MQLIPNGKAQFIDSAGQPLASGTVGFYFPGTLNPKPTYQDMAGTIANPNPVPLDSRGQALIWGAGIYRQIVKDASGVTIWDQITEDSSGGLIGNMTDDLFVAGDGTGKTFIPGTTTQLTLDAGPGSIANTSIFFDGTYQADNQIASINGVTLTFNSPIPVGVQTVTVKIGNTISIGVPADGSVTASKIAPGAVGDVNLAPGSRVAAISKLFVTPEMFGAVGDWNGTTGTDNTTAFAALNAYLALNGGGRVRMANSYYLPAGWVLPCGNIEIDGSGSGLISSLGVTNPGLSATGFSNITVRGLQSSIPLTNLRSGFQINLLFTNCDYLTIDKCRTLGGVAGIWTFTCNNVSVTGCYVDTPKADGIHFGQGSTFCKAIGNTVRNAADDSIATTSNETGFSFPRSRSIVIANNVVDGSIAGAGVNIYSSDDVIVSGNILRNIGYSGISVSFFEDAICNNVTIVGNMVDGCGQAEVQPNHYWFNSPLPDPPVTAPSFQSGIFAEGNGISIKNNTVTNAVSLPNGNPRTGTYLNGGSLISVTGNTFTVINGVGIDTGGASIAELTISGNTLDQVLDIGIWAHAPVTISQSITNNTGGFGAVGASPDLVVLQNAGATRTVITGNSSSGGRGISTDGTSTNFLASGNFS